jgi:hypothetical protein
LFQDKRAAARKPTRIGKMPDARSASIGSGRTLFGRIFDRKPLPTFPKIPPVHKNEIVHCDDYGRRLEERRGLDHLYHAMNPNHRWKNHSDFPRRFVRFKDQRGVRKAATVAE